MVFQTTSNLTPSNYSRCWNSAVSVAGNTELYTAYTSYFGELAQQDRANWEYTYANAGAYRCTSSPRGQHHRHRHRRQRARQRQVHLERRQRHPPHRHPGRDAEDHPPSGRGQAALLAAAGCTVDIVYSETDTGTWNALHGQPRLTTRCYQHDDDANPATPNRIVHSKNMMIDGMYAGARHKLVFTGSHNWSGPALRDNDEAMLRITTPSVYDAFTANLTGCGRPPSPACRTTSPPAADAV